ALQLNQYSGPVSLDGSADMAPTPRRPAHHALDAFPIAFRLPRPLPRPFVCGLEPGLRRARRGAERSHAAASRRPVASGPGARRQVPRDQAEGRADALSESRRARRYGATFRGRDAATAAGTGLSGTPRTA